jgi:TP901 family phage tail tape measure protein
MAIELRKMGVRLTAEGVNQYKDDLRSAGREARLMSQETRLAMAELGHGASSTDKLTTRLKGLGNEYKVQENRVKTLNNAQKEFQTSLNFVGREIKTTSSQLEKSQKETNRLEKEYRKLGETAGWNADETKKAKQEWEASKEETKQLANSLNDLEKEQNQYTKELEKMPSKINSAKISMQEKANEMARLREEYIKNGGELGKYADAIQDTSQKVRTFSEGMADVGDKMTVGVTVPIAAGVTAVVKAASDWESAFAGTKKTVDEVVDANGNVIYSYEQLEGELRSLAKQLPATHSEIAGVAEAAGQLGIETDNVVSFTKTMIDMGESTNLSAEQAASSMARLANITGMSQNDFDRLGSAIVGLGNNFATTEAEILEMGLRLAGTGNQIGMTEADIMALGTAMSSVGVQAEAGGTAMSTVLKRMQNAVADGSEELDGFAKVARMSASEFADAFENDPARALQAFVEGLEQSSDEGDNLNSILGDLGITGIREADTLLRLAGNSELLGEALDMSATSWDENSALAEEAGIRYETLESQLGMLRNEVYDVAIEFGGPFVQALRDGIEAARPMLDSLSDMAQGFSELDESQQQTIIKLIGITVAAGPALSILGRVGQGAATAGDGLAWLVRKVGGLQASADSANPSISETGSTIGELGPIATTASGSKGVGSLVTAIGTNLPWALGVAAAATGGWAVWKLWGEEAWEAGQRTRRWGTDVGEATDDALTSIQDAAYEAGGQFGLMREGFDVDTGAMVGNFETMGQVIENSLVERISKLDDLIAELPDTLEGTLGEILTEDKAMMEESLEAVRAHNERVTEIRQNAANNNRDITAAEAKQIQDLNAASAESYVKTLGLTQDEQQTVLNAMTGNVEEATKKQARDWAQSLGEQRQSLKQDQAEKRKLFKEDLEETGLYSEARVQEIMEMWDEGHKATTDGIDQQLAAIAEKYPEIADEVFFGNGQIIDAMSNGADSMISENEKIIQSAQNLSTQLAENAEQNAEQIAWVADEALVGAETWNGIVFDEKTGEVKSNVREEVIKASEDATTWNHIRFQLHNADLDSNAKSVIGEAAIVNGWWDGMSWEDKQAVLQDEFTQTIYKSLEESGKWNEMELEEQTAIMYSNTPEKMTETLAYLGLWDEYEADIKEVNADNYGFINTIRQSEEMMNVWENIDPETKELLGENYDLLTTIFESEERFNAFKNIPDEEKKLLAENTDLLDKVTQSEETYGRWSRLPDDEKKMLVDNTDLLMKILTSEQELNNWNLLNAEDKKMRAEYDSNALAVIPGVERWNEVIAGTPGQTNSNATMSTNAPTPTNQVNRWTDAQDGTYSTNTEALAHTNSPIPTAQVNSWTKAQDGTYSTSTNAQTSTNASRPTDLVNRWTDAQNKVKSTTTTASTSAPNAASNTRAVSNWTGAVNNAPAKKKSVFTTIRETITSFVTRGNNNKRGRNATGNPYFEGGETWLGDGGKREPFLTPQGQFGVSGSDWELYDLPRGTRIWPTRQAFKTSARYSDGLKGYLDQLPKFAKGGTIQNPYDGYTGLVGEAGPEIFQIAQGKVRITPISQSQKTQVLNNQNGVDMSQTNELLQTLIQLVAQGQVIQMDGTEVGRTIYDEVDNIMNKNFNRKNIMSLKGGV